MRCATEEKRKLSRASEGLQRRKGESLSDKLLAHFSIPLKTEREEDPSQFKLSAILNFLIRNEENKLSPSSDKLVTNLQRGYLGADKLVTNLLLSSKLSAIQNLHFLRELVTNLLGLFPGFFVSFIIKKPGEEHG
jgi:hypothetical protein